MNSRDRAEKTILSLDVACYHAAKSFPGGIEALAPLMQRNVAVLRSKLNPTCTTHNLSALEVGMIAELTQDRRILESMCHLFGAGYFILPTMIDDDGSLFERSAAVMREVGDLMDTVRGALNDGHVDADEASQLEKALLEAIAAARQLVEAAKFAGHYSDRPDPPKPPPERRG